MKYMNVYTLNVYGLIIRMYYAPKEHNPPHIYVFYQDFSATVEIKSCEMLEGELASKQLRLVAA